MSPDNQYTILKYFYQLKHDQNNRLVDWNGVFTELSPQLNAVTAQETRSWWTKWGYVEFANDVFVITPKGEQEFKRQQEKIDSASTRSDRDERIKDLELLSGERKVKWFYPTLIVALIGGISTLYNIYSERQQQSEIEKIQLAQDSISLSFQTRMDDSIHNARIEFQSEQTRTNSLIDSLRTRIDSLEARAKRK